MKIQNYEVEGTGHFPIDMLRYDMAWPYDSLESGKVDNSDFQLRRIVKLCRAARNKSDLPYDDRWKSFGWRVVPGSVRTY